MLFFLFLLGILVYKAPSFKKQVSLWKQCMETVFISVTKTLLFGQFRILLFASRHPVRVYMSRCVCPVFLDRDIKIFFLQFNPDSKIRCAACLFDGIS